MAQAPRKWFDQTQPQTLQGAVMLCYLNAAFAILALITGAPYALVALAEGVGAFGIANERKWGYWVAVISSVLYLLAILWLFIVLSLNFWAFLNLLFSVVLVVLLLHPQSRSYQKIWFR
jgi:hypothetical protein